MTDKSPNQEIWEREKPELLKTHRDWYVAYCNGKRVALAPSLQRLEEDLGGPREPCEFHQIIESIPKRRGPSPRTYRGE